jgi:flagellin
MNAYRNYNTNTSALSKNLEKLSSGYRINRAGDDAAGLAISEKMRAQISGLEQASNNVGDGISLVQTAEGALQEVQDMLNRMVTLSEESANGTYQDDVDRENLQSEMDALKEEINRIADSANFNGISLLDGSMAENTVIASPTAVSVTQVADGAHNGTAAAGKYTIDLSQLKYTNTDATKTATITIKIGNATVCSDATCTQAITNPTLAANSSLTGAKLATAINGKYVKIGTVVYSISGASTGIVTLTGKTAPSTTPTQAMSLALTAAGSAVTANAVTNNQGQGQSVQVTTQAVSAAANQLAQGKFDLTTTMVKDGNALNIGGTSYIFKVGSNSTVTTTGNIIDLSKYDGTTNTDNMLLDAAKQITAITNDKFIVSTTDVVNSNAIQIDLTEKDGQVDYSKDWNLAGPTTSATNLDGEWNKSANPVVSYGAIDNTKTTGGLTLQIGDTSDSWNQMTVSIDDAHRLYGHRGHQHRDPECGCFRHLRHQGRHQLRVLRPWYSGRYPEPFGAHQQQPVRHDREHPGR